MRRQGTAELVLRQPPHGPCFSKIKLGFRQRAGQPRQRTVPFIWLLKPAIISGGSKIAKGVFANRPEGPTAAGSENAPAKPCGGGLPGGGDRDGGKFFIKKPPHHARRQFKGIGPEYCVW